MSRVRLFVYGTLKRGGTFHAELHGAPFLGQAETATGHALTRLGEYLALVEDPSGGVVNGELFEVPADLLPALDDFEGEAYVRKNVAVRLLESKEWGIALAYFKKAR